MRGLKPVEKILKDLQENTPWVTLEASGVSTNRGNTYTNYTWTVNAAGVLYRETDAPASHARDGTFHSSPDIPQRVLTDLRQQLVKAKQSADSFYKAALEQRVPGMVIRALDGEAVSWREELIKEVHELRQNINHIVQVAAYTDRDEYRGALQMSYDIPLVWNGTKMGTLMFHKSGMAWEGSNIAMYMVLPQVLTEVNRWLAMLQAARDAQAKEV